MKKLYTLKELKSKYEPDKVIRAIEGNFVIHKVTLVYYRSILAHCLSISRKDRCHFWRPKGQMMKN